MNMDTVGEGSVDDDDDDGDDDVGSSVVNDVWQQRACTLWGRWMAR